MRLPAGAATAGSGLDLGSRADPSAGYGGLTRHSPRRPVRWLPRRTGRYPPAGARRTPSPTAPAHPWPARDGRHLRVPVPPPSPSRPARAACGPRLGPGPGHRDGAATEFI